MTIHSESQEISKLVSETNSLKEKLKAETKMRDQAKSVFDREQKELRDLETKLGRQQDKVREVQALLHTEEAKWQATNSLLGQKETELGHKRTQESMGSKPQSNMGGLH